jgi:hypothetical protein
MCFRWSRQFFGSLGAVSEVVSQTQFGRDEEKT